MGVSPCVDDDAFGFLCRLVNGVDDFAFKIALAKINGVGFDVVLSSSPEDFSVRIKKAIDLTARIVKAAKIEAQ